MLKGSRPVSSQNLLTPSANILSSSTESGSEYYKLDGSQYYKLGASMCKFPYSILIVYYSNLIVYY